MATPPNACSLSQELRHNLRQAGRSFAAVLFAYNGRQGLTQQAAFHGLLLRLLLGSALHTLHARTVTEWFLGSENGVFWKKRSFQKRPFSRDSGEFIDFSDSRKPPKCGKQRRIPPCSARFLHQKDPFCMTPSFGVPRSASWCNSNQQLEGLSVATSILETTLVRFGCAI